MEKLSSPPPPPPPLSAPFTSSSQVCSNPYNRHMEGLYNAWYDPVNSYAKHGPTVPANIFPAISGLASRLGRILGDNYVAGLWKGDLYRGLPWSGVSSIMRLQPLDRYHAPSWPWASLPATYAFAVRGTIFHDINTTPFVIKEANEVTDD
jgi:hypothetical protein